MSIIDDIINELESAPALMDESKSYDMLCSAMDSFVDAYLGAETQGEGEAETIADHSAAKIENTLFDLVQAYHQHMVFYPFGGTRV